jgi:hypothetical protein
VNLISPYPSVLTQHDFDFIQRNPDYHLVHCLDEESYNWLDFDMPDEQKQELFANGVRGAANFLSNFKCSSYKDLRASTAECVRRSRALNQEKANNAPLIMPAPVAIFPGEAGIEWPCGRPKYLSDSPSKGSSPRSG